ncbi:MAG: T9SS type A sorting domain-containing protein [Flavobacteriales bacterium]|jgi:hypothetical protein|nr:T9SS type A sorting domain-containing protein [Flavobacteriales bacterium]
MKPFLILAFFFLSFLGIQAQPYFGQRFYPDIEVNNQDKYIPWTGGLNAPQFNEMDLNKDGIKDLVIFDRADNQVICMLYNPWNPNSPYSRKPEFEKNFPKLESWMLTADFNNDGLMDLFTNYSGRVLYYRQLATNPITWSDPDTLRTKRGPTTTSKLFVSAIDVPAIEDADADGDLDLLTFGVLGTKLEFHENIGTASNYELKLTDRCYGRFTENFSDNSVTLHDCDDGNAAPPLASRHSGSTVTIFDIDGDNDKDMFLGDVSFNNIVMLKNTPNAGVATMTEQIFTFPNNKPIDVQLFPLVKFIDLDKDGDQDMLVTPNSSNNSVTKNSVWHYKNTGNEIVPQFDFQEENYLQKDMIDIGKFSIVRLFDFDQDGDKDLFVSSGERFDASKNFISSIYYYKNIGNNITPKFKQISNDFGGFLSKNIGLQLAPSFGDLDSDGDFDIIMGNKNGQVIYFENTTNNAAPSYIYNNSLFNSVNVGVSSKPFLYDLDGDFDLDLLVGEKDGNINYYENTGTQSNPQFSLNPDTNKFGGIDLVDNFGNGYTDPTIVEMNNKMHLIIGTAERGIHVFDSLENNLKGNFRNKTLTENLQKFDNKRYLSPTIADINQDGKMDMILGNIKGGLEYFVGIDKNQISVVEIDNPQEVIIYPNPAKTHLSIQSNHSFESFLIYSISGNLIQKGNYQKEISVENLSPGSYLIELRNNSKRALLKFIKI